MSAPFEVERILRRYGLKPKKNLGQNFLVDPQGLRQIIQAAELRSDETVLEVGAGLGVLTNALAWHARWVVAVEIDSRLAAIIQDLLELPHKVEVLRADVLDLKLEELFPQEPYVVVANIPYNITSILIRKFLESPAPPDRLILTVQKEVALRATSAAGDMSLFAVSVQIYGVPQVMAILPPESFFPQPSIESAILRVRPHDQPVLERSLIPWIFRLAKSGFAQRRKQLHNSLAAGLQISSDQTKRFLESAKLPPKIRPQELSLADWAELAEIVRASYEIP